MKKGFVLIISIICITISNAQISSVVFNKQTFLNPTIETMGYLMTNTDSAIWNKILLPMGITSLPDNEKVNSLEYKKKKDGFTQYVGFDDRYSVLTVIWKDESGKNSFATGLRKKLKKKEYTTPGTFKTNYMGFSVIISIESNKDKGINEMITMEIERK